MKVVLIVLLTIASIMYLIKRKKKEGEEKVPQGLQTFDEQGNIDVDLTTRMFKVLGVVSITSLEGQLIIDGLAGNTPWILMTKEPTTPEMKSLEPFETDMFMPIVTIVGNTVKWKVYAPPYLPPSLLNPYPTPFAELVKRCGIKLTIGVY